jgi:hypothetical protein
VAVTIIGGYLLLRGSGSIKISDIYSNPGKYIGKQVELSGYVDLGPVYSGVGAINYGPTLPYDTITLINLPSDFIPISSARYLVRGIVVESFLRGLAIDVTSIGLA